MTDVKLCGMNSADAVAAAVAAGARWVGFIQFARSPRHVALADLAGLAERAAGKARRVAVLVDPNDALVDAVAPLVDVLQLHGHESPARVAAIRARTGQEVWKALPVAERADLELALDYEAADRWMFDARPPPGATMPGGNGLAFDARLLDGAALPRPWLLSGGLTADNVGDAVRASGATAVDVSSGIESAPGRKSPDKIRAFMAAARAQDTARTPP